MQKKNPGNIEKNPGPKINQNNCTFQKFLQHDRQISGLILSLYHQSTFLSSVPSSLSWKIDTNDHMDRVKRIWYLSPMRAAKVQASLRIRAVSPEPSLLAHTSSESRGTFRQKARSLAPLNSWACAVKICHDGVLEDTNSLDGAHMV